MRSQWSATEFVLRNQLGRYRASGPAYEMQLRGPGGRIFQADIYVPPHRTAVGTILFIHGMALRGNKDPRIVDTCRNFASIGFRVIAPLVSEIARLEIDPATIEDISDCIRAVCARPEICPGGRLSLFAPSFSGGMSLVAATAPDIAERINAICTIGAPGHLFSTLRYLFAHPELDNYGTMIILKNFGHLSLGRRPKLIHAFALAAIDSSFEPPPPQLPAHLETLSKKDRETFRLFETSSEFRVEQLEIILKKGTAYTQPLNFAERLSGLRARTTLIHGLKDNVIPASESADLFRIISSLGLPTKLEITPLLSHGDSALTPGMLLRVPSLVGAFAHFFKGARDRG